MYFINKVNKRNEIIVPYLPKPFKIAAMPLRKTKFTKLTHITVNEYDIYMEESK